MGLVTSRFNFEGLRPGRRRSQQEETLYSYSLNKNYFSNYFLMGGERYEVNDPDYLFGDNCDLNFLTCTKPYSLPYRKAQQNLLVHLNNKQKAINKVSSRVNSLSSPLNILTGRHRQVSQSRKQDAQTQTLNKGLSNGPEPSQPIVMFINIRKETLRLVKSPHMHNIDSDQNSLMTTNTPSISNVASPVKSMDAPNDTTMAITNLNNPGKKPQADREHLSQSANPNRNSSSGSGLASSHYPANDQDDNIELEQTTYSRRYRNSDASSLTSNTLSYAQSTATSKSGYTSVKDVPPSDCASDDNDECYQDALNEPTQDIAEDNDPPRDQARNPTKENRDIRITIHPTDETHNNGLKHDSNPQANICDTDDEQYQNAKSRTLTDAISKAPQAVVLTNVKKLVTQQQAQQQVPNQVYNIEFSFDAEVDCSIRIFYFCTREVTSNNVSYKPQHATYKSKTYTYKRGLNQKFEQLEHTFQPYLFDEDLLIYKPLDMDGNYNSGSVFPIVIHLAALEGPSPRQSQSLVATVEKSQLDDSYSIKALKQLIFVDGVQYILQDIYGIENKPLATPQGVTRSSSRAPRLNRNNFRSSCASLYSASNMGSNLNLSDTASIASVVDGGSLNDGQNGDTGANQCKSLGSENFFECVICMSEERDTMLLPCRHLCLCSSCAQSLRYQASSCPICRCPFKAALNLRVIQSKSRQPARQQSQQQQQRSWSTNVSNEALANDTSVKRQPKYNNSEQYQNSTATIVRRESITSSATPLLSAQAKHETAAASATGPSHETPVVLLRVQRNASSADVRGASHRADPESVALEMQTMGGGGVGEDRALAGPAEIVVGEDAVVGEGAAAAAAGRTAKASGK